MGVNFRIGLPGPFSYSRRIGGRRRRSAANARPASQVLASGLAAANSHLERDRGARLAAWITVTVLASLDLLIGLPVLIVSLGAGLVCVLVGVGLLSLSIYKLATIDNPTPAKRAR